MQKPTFQIQRLGTGIFHILGEISVRLKTFANTKNRTSKENNRMLFSKGEQTKSSLLRFFKKQEGKLEKISLRSFSKVAVRFHPSHAQPNTLNYSFRKVVEPGLLFLGLL